MARNTRIRLNPISSNEKIVIHDSGLNLKEIFDIALKNEKISESENHEQHFKIFVDGYEIEEDFWKYTKPKEKTEILIAIVLKGGDFGQIVSQVVVVAAIAVASFYTGGGALGALAGAAAGVGASLLMNELIPPPSNAFGAIGGGLESYSDSQMFSIGSQSNVPRKFQTVPKIYGRHRHFPVVAANPYTSIESDKNTGELVQYLYGIYDFGLGPNVIDTLKIGDTPINEFNDVQYRLVDPNKPDTDEGSWDEATNKTFEIYKGDVNQVSIGAALNKNENEAGAIVDEYQVTRSISDNTRSEDQEITVTLAFPKGLTTFGTDGKRSTRTVDVRLEFAEDGTEDWYKYDDYNHVDSVEDPDTPTIGLVALPESFEDFDFIREVDYHRYENPMDLPSSFFYDGSIASRYKIQYRGYKKNTTSRIPTTEAISIGGHIHSGKNYIGTVTSTESRSGGGYWTYITTPLVTEDVAYRVTLYLRNPAHPHNYLALPNKQYGFVSGAQTVKLQGNGVKALSGEQQTPLYATFRFNPKTKESVKLRLTRVRSYGGYSYQITEDLTWVSATARFDKNPIDTTKRHTFLELKIKATDQLNGSIRDLSGVVNSVLDVYNGNTWEKEITGNPAWIFSDLLTGEINKNAISKDRLETNSILAWANYADEYPTAPPNIEDYELKRFQVNYILDYGITLQEALAQVSHACQASLNLVDGKYGVLLDKKQTVPVQVFTPRNSWDFASTRKYVEMPDALKVSYVDEGSNWELRERVVYNDGFDSNSAEIFEDFKSFGITNQEQAFRYGRYMLAQAKLRQETISLSVDFEHLVCTRGDFVLVTQDAMRVGGTPFRVKAVNGNEVTIDASFATEPATSYGYTYRSVLDGIVTSTMTITSSTTATLNGTIPLIGDLIIWGEVDKITYECIVKTIAPNDDMTAQLALVEKNNAIFDAESSEDIPDYDPQISTIQDSDITPPGEVIDLEVIDNSFDCDGGGYVYYIDLTWGVPDGTIYETFEIYVDKGKGFELIDYSNQVGYRYVASEDYLGAEHKFKVLAVSATGSKLNLGEVSHIEATPLLKTIAPSNVNALYINVTNETLQLDWDLVTDCDIDRYLVRFSPSSEASWESSIPLLKTDSNTSMASFQARTGSYFVKAIDWNGNESIKAASAITSIPNLFNLNIIEETNDFPTFPGVLDRVVVQETELILGDNVSGAAGVQEFYSDGEYSYSNFLDLGDIYTVRLQSLIEAEGYTIGDLMVSWPTLAEVDTLSSAKVSDWDVETYYRGRDSAITISNWATLSAIDPISAGETGAWTDWRKFTIGDFTARIFQFKLRLVSNKSSVSPRVFEAKIRADMPDRMVSFDNIVSNVGSHTVNYIPAFKGPGITPAIQITQDNAQTGDYYNISNKTLESFNIIFYDNTNTEVSRQFDVLAKGYGFKHTSTI